MLLVSLPMGAVSDRIGRKGPILAGLVVLAVSTLMFAYALGLPALFAARLMQGAADAITWVVGFALVADMYAPEERGRVTGLILGGTSVAYMIGPSIGGWLYEIGGIRMPFLAVTAMTVLTMIGFAWLRVPSHHAAHDPVPVGRLIRDPMVATCGVVVLLVSAITMFELVFVLYIQAKLGTARRMGTRPAAAALSNTIFHPLVGRAQIDGARCCQDRPARVRSCCRSCIRAQLQRRWRLCVLQAATLCSWRRVADTGRRDVGVGTRSSAPRTGSGDLGLLSGPALGGYLFEHTSYLTLALGWAAVVIVTTLALPVLRRSPA
jgi:predicted MFS family arabinose efflux permease